MKISQLAVLLPALALATSAFASEKLRLSYKEGKQPEQTCTVSSKEIEQADQDRRLSVAKPSFVCKGLSEKGDKELSFARLALLAANSADEKQDAKLKLCYSGKNEDSLLGLLVRWKAFLNESYEVNVTRNRKEETVLELNAAGDSKIFTSAKVKMGCE